VGVSTIFALILVYGIIGVNLEEQDYDFYGEIHREAAESFKQHILPTLPKDETLMVVFPKDRDTRWAEELYAKFLLKPWYAPKTFKWVYRRPYETLGLTNTYCFVSYCAYTGQEDTLFVKVPYEDFQQRLQQRPIAIVTYDDQTNTFTREGDSSKIQGFQHLDMLDFYRVLQPGYFDTTNLGSPYL
jgi:hypothetical protein